MKEIVRYHRCFVCGDQNPDGLQARFFYDGEQAISELITQEKFEGYGGIFHGGILATMLDEVMIKAVLAEDILAVTAEMTVRYVKPVPIGEKIRFTGRVVSRRRRLFILEGEASGEDGFVYASATGKYIEAKPVLRERLTESLD